MKNIFISAYACEPDKGSEPGVGWCWSVEIAKNHRVTVMTRKNNRQSIETQMAKDNIENLDFVYYDPPKWLTFWKKGQRLVQLYYSFWQIGAYRAAKKLHKERKFDAVLALTFGNMWLPTLMHKIKADFIWGPVGGGEGTPKQLWSNLSAKQRFYERLRRLNPKIPLSNPWFKSACKRAKCIIVRTEDSLKCIPQKYRDKCVSIIETGVLPQECEELCAMSKPASSSQDFVMVGRVIPLKFMDIGIKAFKAIVGDYPNAKLHIVGDGEQKKALENLAKSLKISENVIFHGKMSRTDALKITAGSRAMVMTSSKEGGAWVLYEAMMCKKPIICMDTSGMHMLVSKDSGILIPVDEYDELVDNFAAAIKALLDDGALCDRLGENGFNRVSTELTWESKGKFFEDVLNKFC